MKSSFQTILIIVFLVAFVAAIAIFSGIFSSNANNGSSTPQGQVMIWGTLPTDQMQQYVEQLNGESLGYTVDYREHREDQLVTDLTAALADGAAPDLVLFPSTLLIQLRTRLYPVPYTAYSERTFRDTYVDGANIFLARDGILALPLFLDPLVTYYNKTMLAGASFVRPPTTWNGLVQTVPLFTKRDSRGNITQSTVALGESQNIIHFKDILSALFLQTGTSIMSYDASTGIYASSLTMVRNSGDPLPAGEALSFYTNFASTTNAAYSWNRSLPEALQQFLAGRSAFYLGRASELFTIQEQNPNLDFDVQELFQLDGATRPVTYAPFLAVGMLKAAPNPTAAYAAYGALARPNDTDTFSKLFSLPPARRDLLQVPQQNPYITVFFRAALNAFPWLDPNPAASDGAFRGMISNVNSGLRDADAAINEAHATLQAAIR